MHHQLSISVQKFFATAKSTYWFLLLIALPFSSSGQYCPVVTECGSAVCTEEIHLDYCLIMDQAFLDKYQGNTVNARAAALEAFSIMSTKMRSSILGLNQGLNVFFNKIIFPNTVVQNSWSNGNINSNIQSAFQSGGRGCIDRDGIILFTGQDLGWDGFGNNSIRLCDVGTFSNNSLVVVVKHQGPARMAETIAHEIMHTFGFGHRENHPNAGCAAACDQIGGALMCSSGGPIKLSGTCEACLGPTVFCDVKCPCLTKKEPVYDDDFVCPPVPTAVGYNIEVENQFPVLNCGENRDIIKVNVTFINSNITADRNFRVRIGSSYAQYIDFEEDPAFAFNCVKPISVGEDWYATSTVTPGCTNEISYTLAPNEVKTFSFKLRYLGGAPSGGTIPLKIYTGATQEPSFSKDFYIKPVQTVTSGSFATLLQNGQWPLNNPLYITGTVTMNPGASPVWGNNTYDFSNNKKLIFGPGASLVIESGNQVKMPAVALEGCTQMWKGITVKPDARLETSSFTTIEDAQFAVDVQKGGTANIVATKFNNNNFGIRTSALGAGAYNIQAHGNEFTTTSTGLKPTWGSAQQPVPGNKGFAGIYVKDLTAGLTIGKDPTLGVSNSFSNLQFGILSEQTNVTVRDAFFSDFVQEAKPAGYPGPLFTGNAINMNGGTANIKGNYTGIVADPVFMDNCQVGINIIGGSIDAAGCEMQNVKNGIVAVGGANKSYSINWNKIGASDRGISVFYQSGIPGQSIIMFNEVTMNGNPNGIGIGIGGTEMFPQFEGSVLNNRIDMLQGTTGIQVGVSQQLKVTQNFILLSNSSNRFGIKVEGGDKNIVNCNGISSDGNGNNDGIYAIHASRASFLCNTTIGTDQGLHFEGMLAGKNKANIAKNDMIHNGGSGLLLGTDAVVGEQRHKGNKWTVGLTSAKHNTPALAWASRFFVDNTENTTFMPDVIDPALGWFLDEATWPITDSYCSPSTDCPTPAAIAPTPDLDRKIARFELNGTSYAAAQLWLAQRRLYEKLTEEGNPYTGDPDFVNFLTSAQTSGLNKYGNMQISIRQLGGMNETDRLIFATNLLTQNDGLTGNAPFQTNEKSVNDIFLRTVAVGNFNLTAVQKANLETIANSCPLSDGEAVLRARALLNLTLNAPVTYNDQTLCSGSKPAGKRDNETPTFDDLLVYPNPASDLINIQYSLQGAENQTFQLFNTVGQVVKSIDLDPESSHLSISVRDLPRGIYWYKVASANTTSATGKIILGN